MFTLDKRFSALIIGLLLLIFAACTPKSGSIPNTGERPTPAPQSSLANTKWTLVSFGHVDGGMPVVNGSTVTLQFDTEGQVVGSGGCNSYSAHYEVQGNMLSVGEITRTLMACQQEGIGQQEERYIQALETAGNFELTGDHLLIWYEDGQGVLNWVALNSDPTATLRPSDH